MSRRRVLWVSTSTGDARWDRHVRPEHATNARCGTRWHIRHVATHRNGSLPTRVLAFLIGTVVFLRELVLRRPARWSTCTCPPTAASPASPCSPGPRGAARVPVVIHVHGSEFSDVLRAVCPRLLQGYIRATLQSAPTRSSRWGRPWAGRLAAHRARTLASSSCPTPSSRVRRSHQPGPGDPVHVLFLGEIEERKGAFAPARRLAPGWPTGHRPPGARPRPGGGRRRGRARAAGRRSSASRTRSGCRAGSRRPRSRRLLRTVARPGAALPQRGAADGGARGDGARPLRGGQRRGRHPGPRRRHAAACWCPPDDANALAAALRGVVADPERRRAPRRSAPAARVRERVRRRRGLAAARRALRGADAMTAPSSAPGRLRRPRPRRRRGRAARDHADVAGSTAQRFDPSVICIGEEGRAVRRPGGDRGAGRRPPPDEAAGAAVPRGARAPPAEDAPGRRRPPRATTPRCSAGSPPSWPGSRASSCGCTTAATLSPAARLRRLGDRVLDRVTDAYFGVAHAQVPYLVDELRLPRRQDRGSSTTGSTRRGSTAPADAGTGRARVRRGRPRGGHRGGAAAGEGPRDVPAGGALVADEHPPRRGSWSSATAPQRPVLEDLAP